MGDIHLFYIVELFGKLNLYFISKPETQHCRHIASNKNVACSIADSNQKVANKKIGVQLSGTASLVGNVREISKALYLWNKSNPGFAHIISFENIRKKLIKSKVYKIKPQIIKFFNEELYGSEGFKIFKL